MKKLLAVFLLFQTISSFSQSLPNNSMEDWDNLFIYEEPVNWNSPNPYTSLLGAIVVTKSNDAFTGNFSARLESKEVMGGQFVIPGLLTLADFSVNLLDSSYTMNGGYFLQENVHMLTGRYKYDGVNGDSASIFMYNFKNTPESGYDTIGAGYAFLGSTTEWTPFSLMMINFNASVPDTFNVIISSSSLFGPSAGSTLFIDSLSIYTNTGIIDLWKPQTPLKVYPNPASEIVNFYKDNFEAGCTLTIYDNFGRVIGTKDFTERVTKFNTSDMVSGIYGYKLIKGNKVLNSGSFIKN